MRDPVKYREKLEELKVMCSSDHEVSPLQGQIIRELLDAYGDDMKKWGRASGITVQTIYRWRKNAIKPRANNIARMESLLYPPPKEILEDRLVGKSVLLATSEAVCDITLVDLVWLCECEEKIGEPIDAKVVRALLKIRNE